MSAKPKPKKPFSLPIPFLRKKKFVRRHARYDCCIVAALRIEERHFELDGVILELSKGGVLFRPASTYIMDRTGEVVTARFEGIDVAGVIMNSHVKGYGVKLDEEIPDVAVDKLVAEYGLRIAEAA